ncbi:MAG: radical SAM protein [Lachnospiraceae bacterium]|nr:radical SAM protein [Lachnospiraceae bacterium]
MVNRDRLEFFNKRVNLSEVVPLTTPFVVFVDPSGACNLSCKFCPCNMVDYMNLERHKIMSLETYNMIINQLLEFDEQIKVINLYGFGEPLMNKNIAEMVRILKRKKVCREVRITTNGLLLNRKLSDALVEAGVDMVRFSIEALNSDDYKNVCNIDMNYQALVDNISYLYNISRGTKTKVSVKILNVALRNNADANMFYDMYEAISDYTYIQDTTQAWAEFDAYVPEGNYEAGNIGDMMDKDKICSFPLTTMTVHSNGAICVCPQDWKFATQYGNVEEISLKDAWNSKKLFGICKAHLSGNRWKMPYCKDCNVCVSNDDVRKTADVIISRLEKNSMFD